MSSLIKIEKVSEGNFKVYAENGVYLGDFLMKEDGFYDWWPHPDTGKRGFWSAWMLRCMADELDVLNAPYQKEIDEYMRTYHEQGS